jgi:photosystem II stability/assembly factor-like uncharacterized protein
MVGGQTRLLLLSALLAGVLTGCNVPFLGGGEEPAATEAAATSEPTEAAPGAPVALPTEPPPPTQPAGAPAIAHLEAEQLILITHIRMVTPSVGWGIGGLEGAQDHVFRTQDGGTVWEDLTPPEPAPEVGAYPKAAVGVFLDAQVARVLYYPASLTPEPYVATVWSTEDGGGIWTASQSLDLDFLGSTDFPPVLRFADADTGWLLAQQGAAGMHHYPVYLLRTADGGRTWDTAIDPYLGDDLQSCNKTGLFFLDAATGWATVDNCPVTAPELWVTADGGSSWEAHPLPSPANRPGLFEDSQCVAHSPQLLTPAIGFVGVSCSLGLAIEYVYVTQDGGTTWEPHLNQGGELVMLSPRVGFALSRRIYQTLDGGVTWDATKVVTWDGQFSWIDERTGWAVARSDGALALVRTDDAGRNWDLLKPRVGP